VPLIYDLYALCIDITNFKIKKQKEREKIIKCNKLRINRREIKTNKFNSRIKEEQCFIHTLNQELISIFIPKLSKRVSIRLFVH